MDIASSNNFMDIHLTNSHICMTKCVDPVSFTQSSHMTQTEEQCLRTCNRKLL